MRKSDTERRREDSDEDEGATEGLRRPPLPVGILTGGERTQGGMLEFPDQNVPSWSAATPPRSAAPGAVLAATGASD